MTRWKRLVVWFPPLLAAVGAIVVMGRWVGLGSWTTEPTPVELADLDLEDGLVHVKGTAHYPVRVGMDFRPAVFPPANRMVWVYPVFPAGDTLGREIRVLAITYDEPDRLLNYETRAFVGRVREPTRRHVPANVSHAFEVVGYTFAPDYVVLEERPPERGGSGG